jgi:hypothetical protein
MKKNWIIAVEAVIILVLIAMLSIKLHQTPSKVIRFPAVKLGKNERITQAQLAFQTTQIKTIRNIPSGWSFDIDMDTPPNPVFNGSILVGAAALNSTNELPEFEVEKYIKEEEPKAIKAVLMVAEFSGDMGKERKIELNIGKP